MRSIHLIPPLLLACGLAWSQTPAPAPVTTATSAPKSARAGVEPRIEHIQVEDSAAGIDELRVGGETQTITVQPKSGMPAYQVEPKTGERTWKVLGF